MTPQRVFAAVTAACLLRSGGAVRAVPEEMDMVSEDSPGTEDSSLESSPLAFALPELELAASGVSVKDSVDLAMQRACLSGVAQRHAAHVTKMRLQVSGAGKADEMNITTALEELWAAEDAFAIRRSFKHRGVRREAEREIKDLGLDLKAARKNCKEGKTKPYAEIVEDCILALAREGKTRVGTWSKLKWVKGGKEKPLRSSDTEALLVSLQNKFDAHWSEEYLDRLSSRALRKQRGTKKAVKDLRQTLKVANKVIRTSGFKLKQNTAYCERVHEAETPQHEAQTLARVTKELTEGAGKKDGKCQQLPDRECPEGTSPQNIRKYSTSRFGATTSAVIFLYKPVGVPLAAGVGLLLGGVGGATAAVALASVPGPDFILGPVIGSIAGLPLLPQCLCAVNRCEYDEDQHSCVMRESDMSSNVYQWLPYPGTKCTEVSGPSRKKPKCAVQTCTAEDYKSRNPKSPSSLDIFGTLGAIRQEGGIGSLYNCLSLDGSFRGNVATASTLPDPSGEPAENSVHDRQALYYTLGVQKPEVGN